MSALRHEHPTLARRSVFLTVAAMVLAACGGGGGWTPPPPPVNVTTVKAADVPMSFSYAGRASEARKVEVRARVAGTLVQRAYVEGARVKRGDLLFVIDPAPLKAQSNAALAKLAQARAAAQQAESDAKRAEDVFAKGLISVRDRDVALTNRDQTRAALEQAQADADRAGIDLGYTRVAAPVSGVTSVETKPEGSYVSTAVEQSLLTTITQIDPMVIDFSVSESDNTLLRSLMASGRLVGPKRGEGVAQLVMGNGAAYARNGRVEYLDITIDPATGTLLGRAEFPNPQGDLLPGEFVQVVLGGYTLKNAIVIPETAVLQGPTGPYVYVLAGTKAEVRPVTLGLPVAQGRAVDAGLKTGDQVIVDNLMKVQPGKDVVIAPPPGAKDGNGAGKADAGKDLAKDPAKDPTKK